MGVKLCHKEIYKLTMLESSMSRGICAHDRQKGTGDCRLLQNEEIHNLYSSPNFTVAITSRIKWTGHVAHMEADKGTPILI
jgi:hypothetical protein